MTKRSNSNATVTINGTTYEFDDADIDQTTVIVNGKVTTLPAGTPLHTGTGQQYTNGRRTK